MVELPDIPEDDEVEEEGPHPPRRPGDAIFESDETRFHAMLISPKRPVALAQDGDGDVFPVPAYSHTMSIGNFNNQDLRAARLYFTLARLAEHLGFYNIAIEFLYKIVDMSVTSLSYQGKLLTQLTTQHYGIYRKEEFTRGDEEEKKVGGDLLKKINELRMMERRRLDKSELTL